MTNTRNADGTFAPGHPGGPGRPPRQTETAFLLTMADEITDDDWRAITRKAVDAAKAGDGKARAWLSRYLLGNQSLAAAVAIEAAGVDEINSVLLAIAGQLVQAGAETELIQQIAAAMIARRQATPDDDKD